MSSTWQERILAWRYSSDLPKTIVGFWAKATIEALVAIGVPLGVGILVVTSFADISVGTIWVVPETSHPRLFAWVGLTLVAYSRLRCLLTEGVDLSKFQ